MIAGGTNFVCFLRRTAVEMAWRAVVKHDFLTSARNFLNEHHKGGDILGFTHWRSHSLTRKSCMACVTKRCAYADLPNVASNLTQVSDLRHFSYRIIIRANQVAILTNGCSSPNFSASMLYPRLCQSMMTLLPRIRPTSQTRARVGMVGGFFTDN
jgi:hypothetical protein